MVTATKKAGRDVLRTLSKTRLEQSSVICCLLWSGKKYSQKVKNTIVEMFVNAIIEMLIVAFSILMTTYILDMLFCPNREVKELCWIDVLIEEFDGNKPLGIVVGILLAGILSSILNSTMAMLFLKQPINMVDIVSGIVSYGAAAGVAVYFVPYLFKKMDSKHGMKTIESGSDEWINLSAGLLVGMGVYFTLTRVIEAVL